MRAQQLPARRAEAEPSRPRLEKRIDLATTALELRQDISGDAFTATITGVDCNKRLDAGHRIKEALMDSRRRLGETIPIGTLAGLGLAITVSADRAETYLRLHFPETPLSPIVIAAREIGDEHPGGLVRRLTSRLSDIESHLHGDTQELDTTMKNVTQAEALIGRPFDQASRLADLRARQAEITEALTPKPENDTNQASTTTPASETEARPERPTNVEAPAAVIPPAAYPRPIGEALSSAPAAGAATASSHHDRSTTLSRSDLSR